MKNVSQQFTIMWLLFILMVVVSCKKTDKPLNNKKGQTKTFSSEVVQKWIDMKVKLMQQQPSPLLRPGRETYINRHYAYAGVALYESVVPGMPSYQSLSGQLVDMPDMPQTEQGKAYHWAASANAALALIHKNLFYNLSASNKLLVDSLENALNEQYKTETDEETLQRSTSFGKAVAEAITNWSESDKASTIWPIYVPPTGPGIWEPTPPNFSSATNVHYGDLRPMTPGLLNAIEVQPPTAYSTEPSSDYYKGMKAVYDTSQNLSAADSSQAQYWRNNSTHWFAILKKVLADEGSEAMLDKAALAYCKMGLAQFGSSIVAFKTKYTYNLQRPITYIRSVLGHNNWNSLFPTLTNPDYPDGPVPDYSSSAGAMSSVFGKNYRLNTTGTNSSPALNQGYTFNSFEEAAIHGGRSRFLAGLTTQQAASVGLDIGFKTAEHIDKTVRFLK